MSINKDLLVKKSNQLILLLTTFDTAKLQKKDKEVFANQIRRVMIHSNITLEQLTS